MPAGAEHAACNVRVARGQFSGKLCQVYESLPGVSEVHTICSAVSVSDSYFNLPEKPQRRSRRYH